MTKHLCLALAGALTLAACGGCSTLQEAEDAVVSGVSAAVSAVDKAAQTVDATFPICLNTTEQAVLGAVHAIEGDVVDEVLAGLDSVNALVGRECPDGPHTDPAPETSSSE